MKYSFMTFSTTELSLDENLALAERLGYDGIEPRLDSKHGHGVEVAAGAGEREKIRRAVQESAVELACLATSCKYADPETNAQVVADTHARIDLAGDVGAPALRVFGGQIPEGVSREQAIDLLVESLSSLADHAGERGVTICLETHDDWCDPKHVRVVLERVGHEAIAANWDIMHPVRRAGATMDEAFEALKPWIGHLHIHDGVTEEGKAMLCPIGEGIVDHKRALELLTAAAYDGYISGEWIKWEPYEVHLPRELAAMKMKRYEAELAPSG